MMPENEASKASLWWTDFLAIYERRYGLTEQDFIEDDILSSYFPHTTPVDAVEDDAARWGLEPV